MMISVIIQLRSKSNDRIVKSDAILTKLGGKTYIIIIIIIFFFLFFFFFYFFFFGGGGATFHPICKKHTPLQSIEGIYLTRPGDFDNLNHHAGAFSCMGIVFIEGICIISEDNCMHFLFNGENYLICPSRQVCFWVQMMQTLLRNLVTWMIRL